MINLIKGTVKNINQEIVTLFVSNIGFAVHVPVSESLPIGSEIELFIYMHWNADSGPSLYGFRNELDKNVFLLIIDCPKVGPKLALNILSTLGANKFIDTISSQNEKALTSVSGVGKKAEQIIAHLKHKISKLLTSGKLTINNQDLAVNEWQNLSEALISLGYSKSEVSSALNYLGKNSAGKQTTFDQLLRGALAFFSANKQL